MFKICLCKDDILIMKPSLVEFDVGNITPSYQSHHLNGLEISDDLNALLVMADMINF